MQILFPQVILHIMLKIIFLNSQAIWMYFVFFPLNFLLQVIIYVILNHAEQLFCHIELYICLQFISMVI